VTTEAQAGTSQSASGGGGSVDDRATTFQAVSGNEAPHYSGEVLLVSAYALVWTLLFVWVAFVWRRQRGLDDRLADLEKVLDRAAAAPSGSKGGAPKAGA
jgi:CcmD family protein